MKVRATPNGHRTAKQLDQLIREVREARRMTPFQLAKRAHISRPTLTQIETGNPTTPTGALLSVIEQLGMLGPLVDAMTVACSARPPRHRRTWDSFFSVRFERDGPLA